MHLPVPDATRIDAPNGQAGEPFRRAEPARFA
jgi:hypothetical protein